MNWQPALGKVLFTWRKRRNISQQQLAEGAGLHRTTIGSYEKGKLSPKKENLFGLLRALNADPELFFQDVGMLWGRHLKEEIPHWTEVAADAERTSSAEVVAEAGATPTEQPPSDPTEPLPRCILEALNYIVARLPKDPVR